MTYIHDYIVQYFNTNIGEFFGLDALIPPVYIGLAWHSCTERGTVAVWC
jgi:hypothetical protein